jgi:hypothetical protein
MQSKTNQNKTENQEIKFRKKGKRIQIGENWKRQRPGSSWCGFSFLPSVAMSRSPDWNGCDLSSLPPVAMSNTPLIDWGQPDLMVARLVEVGSGEISRPCGRRGEG